MSAGGLADGAARQQEVRQHNLALVLRHILDFGPVSRAGIASSVGLTKATISSLVEDLLAAGLVSEGGPRPRGVVGRPGTELTVNAGGPVGVGLEINVDYLCCGVVDLAGRLRRLEVRRAEHRGSDRRAVLRAAADMAVRVLTEARAAGLRPAGMSVAVPGLVDAASGHLRWAPNLGWHDVPVADLLGAQLAARVANPPPLHVDNEANLAALGELWYGGGAALGDFVHVSGEIGIGAGLIVDQDVFRGAHGYAGELGHVSVDPAGPACACGARGCLERYAGQEALLRAAGLPGIAGTSVGDPTGVATALVAAADDGHPALLAALRRAGWALGVALASLVNLLDPDTVVLGGLYARLAPWLLDPVRDELSARAVGGRGDTASGNTASGNTASGNTASGNTATGNTATNRTARGSCAVVVSRLGSDAAVRGGAGQVVRQLISAPRAVE